MSLNRGDQSVTIDLPEPLHSGSSVTNDEHQYLKVNIPSPIPEEQDCANPPHGRAHVSLAIATPTTPWKPRITLLGEANDLLAQGMREDYNCEPESSTMAQEPTTKVGTSPSQKAEVLALPLDTSSQVSAKGMEASMESNPIYVSPTAVAHGTHSDSPAMELLELQTNANLAVTHMLSIRRSLDLERQ